MATETDETTETEEPDAATSSGNEGSEASDTSTSTDSDENDAGTPDAASADSDADPLTTEERARKESLLGGDTKSKELNDTKSRLGRVEKESKAREAELLGIIEAQVSNAGDGKQTPASNNDGDDEPNYHKPSQDFANEDGSLNVDGLAEWNYLSSQQLYQRLLKAEKAVQDLGGDLSTIHSTAQGKEEAAAFKQRYGLSGEVYTNFKEIQESKGDLDAFEYLTIEKKETDAIQAAQAHRDSQRSTAPFSNDGAPTSPTGDGNDIAAQVAKEILDTKRGDDRDTAVQSVPFKYPQEVSSRILRLVAQGL